MPRPLRLLPCITAALLLAGCSTMPSPADSNGARVPVWHAGDRWAYYDNATGVWQNETVEALEDLQGTPSYRVRMEWSNGEPPATRWYHRSTFGQLAGERSGIHGTMDCELHPWFPHTNSSYGCRIEFGFGTGMVNVTQVALGTEMVSTNGLVLHAFKTRIENDYRFHTETKSGTLEEQSIETIQIWYAHEAGNLVRAVYSSNDTLDPSEQNYLLQEWTWRPEYVE